MLASGFYVPLDARAITVPINERASALQAVRAADTSRDGVSTRSM
jgi:hypothetical protein